MEKNNAWIIMYNGEPLAVSFDSHLNEITDNANIYYDVQIQIEPFYYQEKRNING